MSDIRFEGWLHRSGTGGVYQDSAGNVGIASTQPKTRLDIQNGAFQIGPAGICTAPAFIPSQGQLSNRNIIINGDFRIAQRGTSSTSTGYQTVDRFRLAYGGTDEAPTQAQADLSSSDTPYSLGFRKSYKITNGNQTSGADAGDYIVFYTALEAQDLANSGWNYTSTSSNITLSFWAKSSVTKTFIVKFTTIDGTQQAYNHSFTLSANTWTKVTHTFPGDSDLTFDNDTNNGLEIQWDMYSGTTYTSGSTVNQWVAYNGYTSTPDQTSDWYTTNDATFEITGVQLEVGSVATPFEHRSFGDEMARCKRYYNKVFDAEGQSGEKPASLAVYETSSAVTTIFNFPKMRNVPTLDITNGTNKFMVRSNSVSDHFDTMTFRYGTTQTAEIVASSGVSGTAGYGGFLRSADTDVFIAFSAEL